MALSSQGKGISMPNANIILVPASNGKSEIRLIKGHCGRDPETKITPSGKAVCEVSVAVSEGKGDAKTTTWYKCTAWEDDAELLTDNFRKGDAIHIEGPAKVREYQGKEYPEITAWYLAKPIYKRREQAVSTSAPVDDNSDVPF